MARKNPEQRFQIEAAQFLALALRPPTIWTAFPAGGGGKVRGALLKAMGLKKGWPDLLVIHPTLCGAGARHPTVIGLELKAKRGSLSPEQKDVRSSFDGACCPYLVCRSLEQMEGFLRAFGVPLHAHVAGASPRTPEQARAA